MPLPKPHKDEDKPAFMSRCMSELKEEYPKQDQRVAVCLTQWSKGTEDKMNRSWYEIRDTVGDTVEVLLYDEIGSFGVSAKEFVNQLHGVKARTINLRINSPGGDVFDGVAIYNALKNHPAAVHAVVDGLAASSASFISQAGDTVLMATGSTMMIHEPNGMTMGDASDHAKMAETLNKMGDTIASFYAMRAGGDEALWRSRMAQESWYRAQEAVDIGLADGVVGSKAENRAGIFNLSSFKNVPDWVPQAVALPIEEPEPVPVPGPEQSATLEALREGVREVVRDPGEIARKTASSLSSLREGIEEVVKQ